MVSICIKMCAYFFEQLTVALTIHYINTHYTSNWNTSRINCLHGHNSWSAEVYFETVMTTSNCLLKPTCQNTSKVKLINTEWVSHLIRQWAQGKQFIRYMQCMLQNCPIYILLISHHNTLFLHYGLR